jgi:hypothetical protein
VHKLADLAATTKQMKRLKMDVLDLRKQLETSAQSVEGVDFSALLGTGDAEREALKRRVALLTELCEQNGVVIPPADAFSSGLSSGGQSASATASGSGNNAKGQDGNVMELIARACDVPMDSVPGLVPGLLKEVKGMEERARLMRIGQVFSANTENRKSGPARRTGDQAADEWAPDWAAVPSPAAAAATSAAGLCFVGGRADGIQRAADTTPGERRKRPAAAEAPEAAAGLADRAKSAQAREAQGGAGLTSPAVAAVRQSWRRTENGRR